MAWRVFLIQVIGWGVLPPKAEPGVLEARREAADRGDAADQGMAHVAGVARGLRRELRPVPTCLVTGYGSLAF